MVPIAANLSSIANAHGQARSISGPDPNGGILGRSRGCDAKQEPGRSQSNQDLFHGISFLCNSKQTSAEPISSKESFEQTFMRAVQEPRVFQLPTSPPISSPSPSTSATNEPDDQQQDQRADGGVDDRCNDARAKMNAELRKQPTADEGANDADDDISDDPKPGAMDDLTGQPSGNEANHQYDQQTFTRHVHRRFLLSE